MSKGLICNFPNRRAAALAVLGVKEDRDAVARAVAAWNAGELEEAIIAAKVAGGFGARASEMGVLRAAPCDRLSAAIGAG